MNNVKKKLDDFLTLVDFAFISDIPPTNFTQYEKFSFRKYFFKISGLEESNPDIAIYKRSAKVYYFVFFRVKVAVGTRTKIRDIYSIDFDVSRERQTL